MDTRNQDFMQGVGDEITRHRSPLLKRAEEREWLEKVGMSHLTMEEFISRAEQESREFRRGLKEAMMLEGVGEEVIEGMFKEAELALEMHFQGEMEKSANLFTSIFQRGIIPGLRQAGNQALRAMKAPVLEGVAKARGFGGADALVENIAPGLGMKGFEASALPAMAETQRGTLRMGLGNLLETKTPFKGLGQKIQNSGERAMGRQATRLNAEGYTRGFNDVTRTMSQEGRMAGGPSTPTIQKMEDFKNRAPGNLNDQAGAVPASVVTKAQHAATQNLANPGVGMKTIGAPGGGGLGSGHIRFTPGKGLGRGLMGAGIGGMLGGPIGATLGGVGGLATGTLGTGGAALATGAAGLYGAHKMFGGGNKPDETGLPTDRNRIIPGMKNNWTGALGGALLASIIGRQMGLEGPMSWLLPLLGGAAGYKFLPNMMNSWSDRPGTGVNAVPEIQRRENAETFGYRPGA